MLEQRASRKVYDAMCEFFGTSNDVALRRDVMDINEILTGHGYGFDKNKKYRYFQNMSGSTREGFNLKGSDIDMMIWMDCIKVIWRFSQSEHYKCDNYILCFDSSKSPPGYGLLEILPKPDDNEKDLDELTATIEGKMYLPSSGWKSIIWSRVPKCWPHGPCLTFSDTFDLDIAICIISEFWPPSALSFTKRCQSWLKPELLQEIVINGCHIVPIGHSKGNHEQAEWRVSFSKAENSLVCAMNHCQFLLYGIMKMFLNEVINKSQNEDEKLLCSYHMKTALFWTCQNNSLPECCPENLLKCFWVCLKLVIKWVYEGVCPNFFIPENNMFLSKIYGCAQRKLFSKLYTMYETGFSCLLECPSIQVYISESLTNEIPKPIANNNKPLLAELFMHLEGCCCLRVFNLQNVLCTLKNVKKLLSINLIQIQALMVQKTAIFMLQHMAFHIMSLKQSKNKYLYTAEKLSFRAIKLSVEYGGVSDLLFGALYYYKKNDHQKALAIIKKIKRLLVEPSMIHFAHIPDRSDRVTGNSLSLVERKTFAHSVVILCRVFYIDELVTEQKHSLKYPWPIIRIPPFVFACMLEFLCYRHVDTQKAQSTLEELSALLTDEHSGYLTLPLREISWQILGICLELSGRFHDAFNAYEKSLEEHQENKIKSATEERMHNLIGEMQKTRNQ